MQDLGPYGVMAINDSGVIVGGNNGGWPDHAIIKYPGQPVQALLGDMVSCARAINSLGQVVGQANPNWPNELYWNFPDSFLQKPGEAVVLTHNPFGSFDMAAWGINDNGQIVGHAQMGWQSPDVRGWLMNPGQPLEYLDPFPGGNYSSAQAINNQGQIAGNANGTGINVYHAFLKNPGQPLQDLGTLGGDQSQTYFRGINAQGQIVGQSQIARGDWHAFIKNQGEAMQDLNNLTVNIPAESTFIRPLPLMMTAGLFRVYVGNLSACLPADSLCRCRWDHY